jgi:hypothetical protein
LIIHVPVWWYISSFEKQITSDTKQNSSFLLKVCDLNENVPKISTRRLAINTEFLVAL